MNTLNHAFPELLVKGVVGGHEQSEGCLEVVNVPRQNNHVARRRLLKPNFLCVDPQTLFPFGPLRPPRFRNLFYRGLLLIGLSRQDRYRECVCGHLVVLLIKLMGPVELRIEESQLGGYCIGSDASSRRRLRKNRCSATSAQSASTTVIG